MEKVQRFADLSREEIAGLIEGKESKNTQLVTKTALNTFRAFCGEKHPDKTQDFEKISKEELNELLVDFYPNARKKTGGHYKKSALSSIRFGLQRHFMLKRQFNIISDPHFKQSNQVFEAVVVELKRQGFAKVEHHEPILTDDLAKIYSSYDPSSPDPKSLQYFVWFSIMFHLIRRGRENLRLHKKQSFSVSVDGAGRKYVYQHLDELDKNHRQNDDPFDSSGDGRMYENTENPALCPVRAFELYLSKLYPSLDLLWQKPKAIDNFNESDGVWYCNAPLGKNTLGSLMKTISVEYKLSKVYTNHCIRSTAVSVLDNNNFEARHIMRVSGHKSETSIRSYSRQLTECKQREISHTLTSACAQSATEIVPVSTEADQSSLTNLPSSPMLAHNFAASQETVHFHSGAFSSGCNITVNFNY